MWDLFLKKLCVKEKMNYRINMNLHLANKQYQPNQK